MARVGKSWRKGLGVELGVGVRQLDFEGFSVMVVGARSSCWDWRQWMNRAVTARASGQRIYSGFLRRVGRGNPVIPRALQVGGRGRISIT